MGYDYPQLRLLENLHDDLNNKLAVDMQVMRDKSDELTNVRNVIDTLEKYAKEYNKVIDPIAQEHINHLKHMFIENTNKTIAFINQMEDLNGRLDILEDLKPAEHDILRERAYMEERTHLVQMKHSYVRDAIYEKDIVIAHAASIVEIMERDMAGDVAYEQVRLAKEEAAASYDDPKVEKSIFDKVSEVDAETVSDLPRDIDK